jgi:hypothetical protein
MSLPMTAPFTSTTTNLPHSNSFQLTAWSLGREELALRYAIGSLRAATLENRWLSANT